MFSKVELATLMRGNDRSLFSSRSIDLMFCGRFSTEKLQILLFDKSLQEIVHSLAGKELVLSMLYTGTDFILAYSHFAFEQFLECIAF